MCQVFLLILSKIQHEIPTQRQLISSLEYNQTVIYLKTSALSDVSEFYSAILAAHCN